MRLNSRPCCSRRLLVALLIGLFGLAGCKSKSAPDAVTTAASEPQTASQASVTATSPATSNAAPSAPALAYESVPMQLPPPIPEPTPEQDPSQYQPATPAWPQTLTPIFASELVQRIKQSGKKGVLVNVWASWCGPCKVEMPMLLKVRQQYQEQGLDVWFVSVDKSERAARVLEVLNERGVPAPHWVTRGHLGFFKEAISPIWKGSLPSTFLFDASGKVRYYWGAQVLEPELTPLLDDFLADKLVDGVANFKVRRGTEGP